MKRRSLILIILVVVIAFVAGWTTARPQAWMYRQVCSEQEMETLGPAGWELVTATTRSNDVTCFYLKKPL